MRGKELVIAVLVSGLLAPGPMATPDPEGKAQLPPLPLPELRHRPELKEPFYRRGVEFLERFRREDVGQAIRLFGEVLKVAPEFTPALGGTAEARALRYLFGWDPDPELLARAMAEGKRAVESDPRSVEARIGLGLAQMASDRYTPALSEFDQAVAIEPGSWRAHLYRGLLLRGLKRREEAVREASRTLELAPTSPVAYSLLGDVYQEQRDYASARHAYLIAAQLDQRLIWPRLGLAAAYQRELNFPAAGKTYAATEDDFPEEAQRCHLLSASLLVAGQDYEAAARIYESIPDQTRLSPPLLRRLMLAGRAYSLEKLDRKEEAEYFWNRIVEEFPEDFDGAMRDREIASQAFEALARYREVRGDSRQARKLLEQATRHPGMQFTLYSKLAEREAAAGEFESAVGVIRRGLSGAPEEADILDLSQASLPVLRSLAAKAPAATRKGAAAFVTELGRRLAVTNPPTHVPYLNLARAEALVGDRSRAVEYLNEAVRKGYRDIRRASTDPDFRTIAGDPAFKILSGI